MILSTTLLDFGVEIPSGSRNLSICSTFKIQLCLLFLLKVSRDVLKGINLDSCALVLHFLGIDIGTKFKRPRGFIFKGLWYEILECLFLGLG